MKKTIHQKYKENYFKSNDMEELYKNYPDPWRLEIDGHDRYKDIIKQIELRFNFDDKFSILDVGCGEGKFCQMLIEKFPNVFVKGIDISETAVIRAKNLPKRENYCFEILDLGKQKFQADEKYDIIVLGDILYYLESDKELDFAIDSLRTIRKKNGLIILTEFVKSKKYNEKLKKYFNLISEKRNKVKYKQVPIILEKDKELSYRMIVYGEENCKFVSLDNYLQIIRIINTNSTKQRRVFKDLMWEERLLEIMTFTGEDRETVDQKMKLGCKLAKEDWEKNTPDSETMIKWYSEMDSYIYELTANEIDDGKIYQMIEAINIIKLQNIKDILIYGGGCGSDLLPIAMSPYEGDLTVCDVHSKHFDFCKERCKWRNLDVDFYEIKSNTLGEEIFRLYECIIAFDVVEHVSDPEKLVSEFYKHLKIGGYLLMVAMFNKDSGKLPEKINTHPLHITHNKDGVQLRGAHFKSYLRNLGFDSDWKNYGSSMIKILRRK